MKSMIIALVALSSLSVCALAGSKQIGFAQTDDQAKPAQFDSKMVEACGPFHLTFDCRLSRELAKGFETNKI